MFKFNKEGRKQNMLTFLVLGSIFVVVGAWMAFAESSESKKHEVGDAKVISFQEKRINDLKDKIVTQQEFHERQMNELIARQKEHEEVIIEAINNAAENRDRYDKQCIKYLENQVKALNKKCSELEDRCYNIEYKQTAMEYQMGTPEGQLELLPEPAATEEVESNDNAESQPLQD